MAFVEGGQDFGLHFSYHILHHGARFLRHVCCPHEVHSLLRAAGVLRRVALEHRRFVEVLERRRRIFVGDGIGRRHNGVAKSVRPAEPMVSARNHRHAWCDFPLNRFRFQNPFRFPHKSLLAFDFRPSSVRRRLSFGFMRVR